MACRTEWVETPKKVPLIGKRRYIVADSSASDIIV